MSKPPSCVMGNTCILFSILCSYNCHSRKQSCQFLLSKTASHKSRTSLQPTPCLCEKEDKRLVTEIKGSCLTNAFSLSSDFPFISNNNPRHLLLHSAVTGQDFYWVVEREVGEIVLHPPDHSHQLKLFLQFTWV